MPVILLVPKERQPLRYENTGNSDAAHHQHTQRNAPRGVRAPPADCLGVGGAGDKDALAEDGENERRRASSFIEAAGEQKVSTMKSLIGSIRNNEALRSGERTLMGF